MKITSINIFNNLVLNNPNKIIVLKFTATWCGPCQRIKTQYENLSSEYSNVIFTEIDVDEMEKLTEHFEVSCMPTFIFIKSHQNKYETLEKIEGANINTVKQTCTKLLRISELEKLNINNNANMQEQVENEITQPSPESYSAENNHSDVDFTN
jgi:thioredoxin 1